jgi:hypothetical protein
MLKICYVELKWQEAVLESMVWSFEYRAYDSRDECIVMPEKWNVSTDTSELENCLE